MAPPRRAIRRPNGFKARTAVLFSRNYVLPQRHLVQETRHVRVSGVSVRRVRGSQHFFFSEDKLRGEKNRFKKTCTAVCGTALLLHSTEHILRLFYAGSLWLFASFGGGGGVTNHKS